MLVSQKCQYALRAIFELARRNSRDPVKISDIAEAQAIPMQFLEVILSQLKQGRFVESKRGSKGGYFLICSPSELTVGDVVRFIQGPIGPVECVVDSSRGDCPLYGDCAFLPMWEKIQNAISDVYDNTTFQDLVDQESRDGGNRAIRYSI
jgi:Rrf2 family cysteine metabolism transcriptional repressor